MPGKIKYIDLNCNQDSKSQGKLFRGIVHWPIKIQTTNITTKKIPKQQYYVAILHFTKINSEPSPKGLKLKSLYK